VRDGVADVGVAMVHARGCSSKVVVFDPRMTESFRDVRAVYLGFMLGIPRCSLGVGRMLEHILERGGAFCCSASELLLDGRSENERA